MQSEAIQYNQVWNRALEKPAVMTNPFLMPMVVGKITSFKDLFSPYVGYSSSLSFQISEVLTRELSSR